MAPLPPNSHSRYLGGGRGCGRLPQRQGAPRSGSTSLPKDETAVGSVGAGASLDVVGIGKQKVTPSRVKDSPAHRSEEGGRPGGKALIMPIKMNVSSSFWGNVSYPRLQAMFPVSFNPFKSKEADTPIISIMPI